ncbi:FMN reductase [Solwaraspora sp. WMMD1047]|uniref:FMN reductase n=1 Tax=Solwaraspora sp. WMMD1047 TaxID=3016102 RepID=UPI002417EE82|nr:FMN reductase [Solwaraspora sp. WMMD1047]MDG4832597.1 FMN reductase [Solwaraspora sp. WMMD1047]
MPTRRLAVVSAGLSQPSSTRLLADRLAAATRLAADRHGTPLDVDVVDLRDHAHDLVNAMLTGFPAPDLDRTLTRVTGADALIAVTPIFNASYSGLFKSFFDVVEEGALREVPVLIAATGGTARHSLALEHAIRPLFVYLRAEVVTTSVFAAPEDWAGGTAAGPLATRIDRAAAELAGRLKGTSPHRHSDPFADPTPFEKLLHGTD